MFLSPLRRVLGNGLVFSEGQAWKHKRKILNKVFNFNFVKSLCERISTICDESIEEV